MRRHKYFKFYIVFLVFILMILLSSCNKTQNVLGSDQAIENYLLNTYGDGENIDIQLCDDVHIEQFRFVGYVGGEKDKLLGGLLLRQLEDHAYTPLRGQMEKLGTDVVVSYYDTENEKILIGIVNNGPSNKVIITASNGKQCSYNLDKNNPSAYLFALDSTDFNEFDFRFEDLNGNAVE